MVFSEKGIGFVRCQCAKNHRSIFMSVFVNMSISPWVSVCIFSLYINMSMSICQYVYVNMSLSTFFLIGIDSVYSIFVVTMSICQYLKSVNLPILIVYICLWIGVIVSLTMRTPHQLCLCSSCFLFVWFLRHCYL